MSTLLLRKPESDSEHEASSDCVFVRSQSVVSRLIGGETLIVPVRGNVGDLASIYSFDQIGSLIWTLLDIPKSLSDLVAAVEQEYDVTAERARKDVEQFLNDMLSAGLAEVRPAAVVAKEPVGRVNLVTAGSR